MPNVVTEQPPPSEAVVPPSYFSSIVPPHLLEPASPLTAEIRTNRVRLGRERISSKLENQLARAQLQATEEPFKNFRYSTCYPHFKVESETKIIGSYEAAVSHSIGRRPTMEDQHLMTALNIQIEDRVYPIQLFGIFDGHGGGSASLYVKNNLEAQLKKTLEEFCARGLTEEAIWNALKFTFIRLNAEFPEDDSGTTATVVMILDGKLWTANVGDSRTILDNGVQLSEDAKPMDPYYKRGIENRGGSVFNKRVNGYLAVARAVGDHWLGSINPRPKITVCPLTSIPKETHLILACDGIYDVSSTQEMAAAVHSHKEQSAEEIAKGIVYSAYMAYSMDNLSALVVKL